MVLMAASTGMTNKPRRWKCASSASPPASADPGTSLIRSIVEAVEANPQRVELADFQDIPSPIRSLENGAWVVGLLSQLR